MSEVFIGREKELDDLNELYAQQKFQMFVLYGRRRVGKTTLLNEFCNYDIFISIAEKKGKQFSSKIFDYISTGKPIVHFYTAEDDINLAALRKYPNALLIKETPEIKNEDIKRFVKFISAEHKPINFKYLKEIYADANPKYTSDLLISIIENNGGN